MRGQKTIWSAAGTTNRTINSFLIFILLSGITLASNNDQSIIDAAGKCSGEPMLLLLVQGDASSLGNNERAKSTRDADRGHAISPVAYRVAILIIIVGLSIVLAAYRGIQRRWMRRRTGQADSQELDGIPKNDVEINRLEDGETANRQGVCPNCGLPKRPEAALCLCGYVFPKHYLSHDEEIIRIKKSKIWIRVFSAAMVLFGLLGPFGNLILDGSFMVGWALVFWFKSWARHFVMFLCILWVFWGVDLTRVSSNPDHFMDMSEGLGILLRLLLPLLARSPLYRWSGWRSQKHMAASRTVGTEKQKELVPEALPPQAVNGRIETVVPQTNTDNDGPPTSVMGITDSNVSGASEVAKTRVAENHEGVSSASLQDVKGKDGGEDDSPLRKISAKAVMTDINFGMEDLALMQKYRLSPNQLARLYKKLEDAGLLRKA